MTSLNHTSTSNDDQGTGEWRQYRAGSVTGSGFATVLMKLKNGGESKTKQTYRMQLLAERITGVPVAEVNAASLSWGKENEDAARVAYELHMAAQGQSVFVERVGFCQHPTLDWVGTSPDGLVGEHGMIEIKCPWNSANHLLTIIHASDVFAKALLGEGEAPTIPVPEEHLPQIQGNLWVLGRQWCDFISYDPRVPKHLQLYVARVQRDEKYIGVLEAEVKKFLDEIEGNVNTLLFTGADQPQQE